MKKMFLLFFLLLTACTQSKIEEEQILLKCQKVRSYEFYDGMNIIGVYGSDEVKRIEMVEVYTPKWDDVNVESLKNILEEQKREILASYENVTYEIDEYRREITSDINISITNKNIQKMKTDDNYKDAIIEDGFSLSTYQTVLENNQYICE